MDSAGHCLKRLRQEKGFSLRRLEDASGISRGLLSRYENNLVNIEFDTLTKIAKALDVSPLMIIMEWLKQKQPELKDVNSKAGKLLSELSKELSRESN